LFLYAFRLLGLGWFVWFFFWSSFFVFLRICDAQLSIWKVFTEVFAMLSPAQQWTVVRHAWHSNIFSCVIACTQCCVSKGSLCTFKCCVLFPKVVPLIRFIEILQTKTFRLSDWATHARTHKKKVNAVYDWSCLNRFSWSRYFVPMPSFNEKQKIRTLMVGMNSNTPIHAELWPVFRS
jgi:hypothetical protein